jgi:hypothetical protein
MVPPVNPVIYCADIGSVPRGRFGWARTDLSEPSLETRRGGTEIVELVGAVADDLAAARAVALGFECPLFVPVPGSPMRLGMARQGEGNRAWSAQGGTSALATGIVEVAWILEELRRRRPAADAYLDWRAFVAAGRGLFLWEAFVTAEAKAETHADDAAVAVAAFQDSLPDPTSDNAVTAERPLSLLGAGLLWSGWKDDIDLLHAPCLVIKASPPAVAQAMRVPQASRSAPSDPSRAPRTNSDPREVERKLALLDEPHVAPLTEFVRRLREVHGPDLVPWFDPTEAGTQASILLLFENPGRKAYGGQGSGFISADNDDPSANNTWHIFKEAGIDRRHDIVAWNIVPWYLGDDRKIGKVGPKDLAEARPALAELLGLLPRLRVVVLLGRKAQEGWDQAAPQCRAVVLRAPHTGNQSLNREPGRREQIIHTLTEARRIAGLSESEAGESR